MTGRNPYAPPQGEVRDALPAFEGELATRGARLLASFVDSLLVMPMLLPLFFFTDYFENAMNDTLSTEAELGATLLGFAWFATANGYLMSSAGQTIGKRMLEIRVVDIATGAIPSLPRQLGIRYGLMWFTGSLPLIGVFIGLIDSLLIFRSDRRCLHDHVAGTKVVRA